MDNSTGNFGLNSKKRRLDSTDDAAAGLERSHRRARTELKSELEAALDRAYEVGLEQTPEEDGTQTSQHPTEKYDMQKLQQKQHPSEQSILGTSVIPESPATTPGASAQTLSLIHI